MPHSRKTTKPVSFTAAICFGIGLLALTQSGAAAAQEGASAVSSNTPSRGLKVTIDVFSGLPNPTFYIVDDKTLDAIETALRKAQKNTAISQGSVLPSRLGYRGVIVENVGGVPDLPTRLEVNRVDIAVETTATRYLMDDGLLEDLLLEEAVSRGIIDQGLLEDINADRFE